MDKKTDARPSKYGRVLSVNTLLEEHKRVVRENLNSENSSKLRKKRSTDVESVFGMIKINIEWGLLSLFHNFIKLLNKQKSMAYS